MAKTTKDSEKTLEKNLEYIGLNLDKIPNFLIWGCPSRTVYYMYSFWRSFRGGY